LAVQQPLCEVRKDFAKTLPLDLDGDDGVGGGIVSDGSAGQYWATGYMVERAASVTLQRRSHWQLTQFCATSFDSFRQCRSPVSDELFARSDRPKTAAEKRRKYQNLERHTRMAVFFVVTEAIRVTKQPRNPTIRRPARSNPHKMLTLRHFHLLPTCERVD
jgi:hypothetical protein